MCSSLAVVKPSLRPSYVFVSIFPPPLVANHRDEERAVARPLGGRRRIHLPERAGRDERQDKHDDRRRCRPGNFDRLAAVELRRFRRCPAGAMPKTHNDINEHALDHEKDKAR